jgi:hypothetical protein
MDDSERRKDLYERLRRQIEHEDNLVNHRLTWFLTLQGLLFIAYATLAPEDTQKFLYWKRVVLLLFSVVGYLTAVFTSFSIEAAHLSLNGLQRMWEDPPGAWDKAAEEKQRNEEWYPKIKWQEEKRRRMVGIVTNMPIIFMFAWTAMAGIVLWTKPDLSIFSRLLLVILICGLGMLFLWRRTRSLYRTLSQ